MIVCSCHAVSDQRVRQITAGGASLDDVVAATGAGTDCGCCKDEVAAIVAEGPRPCRAEPCAGCPRRMAA